MERFPDRLTAHAFSFGDVYDPDHLRFGPMICHDDHLLKQGAGFAPHQHSDIVALTWVLSGALRHADPDGEQLLEPGQVGILRAGAGVAHSEMAAAPQTRFVQVWLTAAEAETPSYSVAAAEVSPGSLARVAEPQPGAVFSVARLADHQSVEIPAAPLTHVFVGRGALLRSSLAEPLRDGDAFMFTDEDTHTLTAGVASELLVWQFF